MGSMKKLLNKTLLYYAIFAIIPLLCSSPLFYWLSEKLYLDDVDEAILLRKEEFFRNNAATLKINEISEWNRFNRDVHILPDTVTHQKNVIFQHFYYDTLAPEWEPYRVLYSDVRIENKPYTLMIRLNLVESQDLVETIAFLYLIILVALFAGFIIISKIISSRLWKPFYEALSQIKRFNIDKNEMPVFTSSNTVEFQQLNNALEKLIHQNLKAYQSQKEFTQNAAHELQTPLAVFQSKLDLLLQNTTLSQQQAEIIQSLYKAASKLSRINKNLLLLAKIENNQFTETSNIHINDILKEVIPYFKEQADSKNLTINEQIQNEITVNGNQTLVEIMINNLLLNAISHNIENGNICIYISGNALTIMNTGSNAALNEKILFRRFSKATSNNQGTGLGLAIIKEISDRYKWKVNYAFENYQHSFSVAF
jgi:signal transduction histidine kinase